MTRREKMQQAIEEAKKSQEKKPVATAAKKGKKPSKDTDTKAVREVQIGVKPPVSQRKAKSRDRRACARGRLPKGSKYIAVDNGESWEITLMIPRYDPDPMTLFVYNPLTLTHTAKGLFQCLEELDLMYRKWLRENSTASAPSQASISQEDLAGDCQTGGSVETSATG